MDRIERSLANDKSKIIYLTAGAAGMFCGSCMHDNALVRAMAEFGVDIQLVPTYTPIRTDEVDVSVDQVFFGGINVYLQQKFPPLRWLPAFLDRFLDNPSLIQRLTARSIDMSSEELGKLSVSMLAGLQGNQRKEVNRLVAWLKNEKPEAIIFTNALIGGCIPEIKKRVNCSVLVTLQGDDVFLDSLPDKYRSKCIESISKLVPSVDGFVVHTQFFKDYMSEYFGIPLEKISVTPLGIDVHEFSSLQSETDVPTLGYLARLSPEKGFDRLVDAFVELKSQNAIPDLKMRVAGWLGSSNEEFAEQQFGKISKAGLDGDFEYVGAIERHEKIKFLSSIDVMSVPTKFLEPKGLYVLEGMACGVPCVQPAHGSFPELINETGGGLLFDPESDQNYLENLVKVFSEDSLRKQLADSGRHAVHEKRNSHSMAQATIDVLKSVVGNL